MRIPIRPAHPAGFNKGKERENISLIAADDLEIRKVMDDRDVDHEYYSGRNNASQPGEKTFLRTPQTTESERRRKDCEENDQR